MFGQKLASGSAAANVPVLVPTKDAAIQLFGLGSMLQRMCDKWITANPWTPLWVVPQADNAAGTAATGSMTLSNSPTVNGTQPLYIDGIQVLTALTAGMTAAQCATAILASINATEGLPVTAAIDGTNTAKINFTALQKGADAGALDIRTAFYNGDANVPGIGVAITAMTGGAGNPSLTTALAALGAQWFRWWVIPYTDGAALAAVSGAIEANWGPTIMRDSEAFFSNNQTVSGAQSFAATYNEKLFVYLPVQNPPQAPYLWATVAAAISAYYLNIDPARPLQTLALTGLMAPAIADRFDATERNMLNFDGCATYEVDDGGVVRIKRFVTTYRTNAAGAADTTFLDVERLATMAYLRFDTRTYIANTYPRFKLADDGQQIGAGQAITTPRLVNATLAARARQWESAGLITDVADFIKGLAVERAANDSNRLNALLPITPVGQFRIFAGKLQFSA
jgi:phage tail sheath gpL-like